MTISGSSNKAQMLCETCKRIPYKLFLERGTFQHGTLHQIKQSAEAGCGFCELLNDSFQLQHRRGKVRIIGNVINEFVILAHSSPFWPILDLLYKDDISQTNGESLWFSVLLGQKGYRQNPIGGDKWKHILQNIKSWETSCCENHFLCAEKLAVPDQFLPTRLIEIGLGNDETVLPKLVLTENLHDKNVKYLTLSHRWGPQELMASTTQFNARTRLSKIDDLPLTFQQAASLAKELDVSYIWIDSSCIIQDSADDKGREIAMMVDVYSNSFLNIVASAGSNPAQGCYDEAILDRVSTFSLEFPMEDDRLSRAILVERANRNHEELSIGLESGTLAERGWLVQERHLPRRAVIFTPRCMMWECPMVKAVKDYPGPERVFSSVAEANPKEVFTKPPVVASNQMMRFGEVLDMRSDDKVINHDSWHRIIGDYSQKKLTVAADKLPAIGGLARKFQDLTGDEYVAGLWKSDLVRQLCWMQTEKQQSDWLDGYDINNVQDWDIRKRYRAPTWSWAYLDLKIYYPEFDNADKPSQTFSSAVSPKIVSTETACASTDHFASVISGSVTLRGQMVVCTAFRPECMIVLPFRNAVYRQETLKRVRIFNRVGQAVGLILLDRQNWTLGVIEATHSLLTVRCLRMWKFHNNSVHVTEDDDEGWACKLIGLALRLVTKEPKKYERIGVVYLRPEVGDRFFTDEGAEEDVTII